MNVLQHLEHDFKPNYYFSTVFLGLALKKNKWNLEQGRAVVVFHLVAAFIYFSTLMCTRLCQKKREGSVMMAADLLTLKQLFYP